MAIKTNMRDELTAILEQDDAVKGGFDAYYEAGFDESKLVLEGEPTRWKLQRMTYDQRQRVQDMTSLAERRESIVRFALLGVTNYKLIRNGVEVDAPPVEHEDAPAYKRPVVKREWLQGAGIPTHIMSELASLAMLLAEGSVPFPAA